MGLPKNERAAARANKMAKKRSEKHRDKQLYEQSLREETFDDLDTCAPIVKKTPPKGS